MILRDGCSGDGANVSHCTCFLGLCLSVASFYDRTYSNKKDVNALNTLKILTSLG